MSGRARHIVNADEEGMRLDALLGSFPDVASRSAAAKLASAGEVLVNGEPQVKRYLVGEGDLIDYPPVTSVAERPVLEPQDIPLDIRFEDDDLIVLSKQAGLVCHPAVGHESGTLANALLAHCGPEHVGTLQGPDRPGIVHRLDRDTTGLMMAAKSNEAQAILQDGIRLRSIDRRYLALVHGYIAPDTGLVDAPLARSTRDRTKMAVSEDPGARSAITTFSVLERFEAGSRDEGYTLIECHLYTGRTHQIRVHMASISHPCVGDPLYGISTRKRTDVRADLGLTRQFLHSYRLSLAHPMTGERLTFADELPWDLAAVLDELADRSLGRTQTGAAILSIIENLPPGGLLERGASAFDGISGT